MNAMSRSVETNSCSSDRRETGPHRIPNPDNRRKPITKPPLKIGKSADRNKNRTKKTEAVLALKTQN